MAALDNLALANAAKAQNIDITAVKALVRPFIWQYFHEHENDRLISIKRRILGIPLSYTLYVRDCASLIADLVGPDTSTPLSTP